MPGPAGPCCPGLTEGMCLLRRGLDASTSGSCLSTARARAVAPPRPHSTACLGADTPLLAAGVSLGLCFQEGEVCDVPRSAHSPTAWEVGPGRSSRADISTGTFSWRLAFRRKLRMVPKCRACIQSPGVSTGRPPNLPGAA